ncbi:MAG: acyl-CoA synthetase FdrA [Ardenticatenales bacterium]|nr:acyl-CoA synthetase FdrA [Ardenticatenales bacterium]
MTSVMRFEMRAGAYFDSVVLMQLQRGLAGLAGVLDAGIVMATPANRELLAGSDLLPPAAQRASADDLLIVVKAVDEHAASAALAQLDTLIQQRRTQAGQTFRPRSLASAARLLPDAEWVLVSVPGRYAAGVAREALDMGKHVFLYSDNVSLEEEAALKEQARAAGRLLMGPDCGTAIINGVGLGFANRVRRGRIGLVGASGTGLQAITSRLHTLGAGVSQAIGVGGRDLSARIGGSTALQALDLLRRDPETDVIVLVSKPPDAEIVTRLMAAAQAADKPVIIYFLGYPTALDGINSRVIMARSLEDAARQAVAIVPPRETPLLSPFAASGYVRGLFSGGTLAYEAMLAWQPLLTPLYSNVPLRPAQALPQLTRSQAHTLLDMGADAFTQGRLHPMMDNDLRLRRLRQEAADPDVGLIVLDVVLGEGAHPNPAAELAPAIAAVKARRPLDVAVLLVGTEEDPQGLRAQMEQLAEVGAVVTSNVDALTRIVAAYGRGEAAFPQPPVSLATLQKPLAAINLGLESFYDSLIGQSAAGIHVEWRPPAGGNEKMMALLAKMRQKG